MKLIFDKNTIAKELKGSLVVPGFIGSIPKHENQNHIHGAPMLDINDDLLPDERLILEKIRKEGFPIQQPLPVQMTPAVRYGSHYCVYPGSPIRNHSCQILHMVRSNKSIFNVQFMVSLGRLCHGVKKVVVICSADSGDFVSLDWVDW